MDDWQLDDSLSEEQIRAAMDADGMVPVNALPKPFKTLRSSEFHAGIAFAGNRIEKYNGIRVGRDVLAES